MSVQSPTERAYRALSDPNIKKIGWAAGGAFDLVDELYRMDLAYVVDRDEARWGKRKRGVPIRSPEALVDEDPERTLIIIYSGAHPEIKLQIARLGPFFSITGDQLLEFPPLADHSTLPDRDCDLALRSVQKAYAFSILSINPTEKFAIYGAGELGRLVLRLCEERGLCPVVILDDLAAGESHGDVPIAGVFDGMRDHSPAVVLLANLTNQQSLRDLTAKPPRAVANGILDTSGTRPRRIHAPPRSPMEVRNEIDAFCDQSRERDPDYAAFLAGKRVALVGPAETTIGSRQQEQIDAADVVVRLNSTAEYLPLPSELAIDMGSRTDVLYFASRFLADFYHDNRPVLETIIDDNLARYIVCVDNTYLYKRNPVVASAVDGIRDLIAERGAEPGFLRSNTTAERLISWLGGYAARTGFIALVDLLSYDIRDLYVTGLTFYHRGGHLFRDEAPTDLYPLRNPTGGISTHNSLREMELMVELVRASGERLELDAPLQQLVQDAAQRVQRPGRSRSTTEASKRPGIHDPSRFARTQP